MKTALILFATILFLSCNQGQQDIRQLQTRIDSLQQLVNKSYKPGLGEFMLGVQQHHARLWFAGTYQNWPLADFEVHEIGETLDDIKQYCTDRPEIKSLGIIDPAINSISKAIKQKDLEQFKKAFTELTADCNTCHKDNQHGFNVIVNPTGLPVDNQNFKPGN